MKRTFAAIVTASMTASLCSAEQALTWEDCVDLTAKHNPSLTAAAAGVDAAGSDIAIARSALLPQLSANASSERNYQDASGTENTSYGASFNVEQSLFNGGSKKAAVRSAEAGFESEIASLSGSRSDVTYALRYAFINVLHAKEQVDLITQIEARRADNLELVELRYEGGLEHKGSVASSQASLFDAQVQGKQAMRSVSVNRQLLARTIGLTSLEDNTVVAGTLEQVSPTEKANIEALAHDVPSYRASLASKARIEAQLSEAESSYWPDVSLIGSVGRYGNEDAFDEDQWAVGVKVSFPFWSGGRTRHEVKRATAALREAEADVESVLNERFRVLASTEQSFADSADNVEVQVHYVEAAEIRAQIARQQYEDGLLSFENWILIEDDLIDKKERLLDARKSALMAQATWWRATGYEAFSKIPKGDKS